MRTVFVKELPPPPVSRKEILRYAGVRGEAPQLELLLEACLAELSEGLAYRVCYCTVPVLQRAGEIDLGFAKVRSAALAKNLAGCDRAVLFAATVGAAPDRLITRYSRIAPTKALLMQAIGTERVEALCDAFCAELAATEAAGGQLRPRFSPGYGDLALSLQRELLATLDGARRIGVTLCESMLMSPTKSVTAIVGISLGEIL